MTDPTLPVGPDAGLWYVLRYHVENDDFDDPNALLPPSQPYNPYPYSVPSIASSLPGTIASPIRIPFGRNRGGLVDLPGFVRTTPGLESFVDTMAIINHIMDVHRQSKEKSVYWEPAWPGIKFDAGNDEAKAFVGTPNGGVAWPLVQHKRHKIVDEVSLF
ncbi:hypothetical protein EJ02DRAFT_158918 [Clathrospora elynae]|uniref:Uncharacterized protein n=1 Tax=Clathrospora elynae TaxID=706981 RepID=A0A6A5S2K4_9PLEO|nr:hypothetical protein EJ02DRAFT_158918 [Clathrospora elynae]